MRCDVPIKDIKVTNHAVTRYRERTDSKTLTDQQVRDTIKQLVSKGALVEHKRQEDAVMAIIQHKCEKAYYYRRAGLVFVVSQDNTVLTVHRGEAKKWRPVYN